MWRDLLQTWRERVHPAASREQVAIAFLLIASGTTAAVLGVLLVIVGDAVLPRPSWLRELGIVAAASGLPLFMVGVVAALPTRRWMQGVAAAGLVFTLNAVILFALWYPEAWTLTIQFPNSIAVASYLVGATLLAGATAGALAKYLVERSVPGHTDDEQGGVSREEIEADLAWAGEQGWSWGGMPLGRQHVELKLRDEEEPLSFGGRGAQVQVISRDSAEPERTAAHALAHMRGWGKADVGDAGVASQVGYLRELKQAKAHQEQLRRERSLWLRFKRWLRRAWRALTQWAR